MTYAWQIKNMVRDEWRTKHLELKALRRNIEDLERIMALIKQMESRIDEQRIKDTDPDTLRKELCDISDLNWDEDPN